MHMHMHMYMYRTTTATTSTSHPHAHTHLTSSSALPLVPTIDANSNCRLVRCCATQLPSGHSADVAHGAPGAQR